MKYGFDNYDESEIIDNYVNKKNKIVITFLDGTRYVMPYSKAKEKELLDDMVIQARNRNNGSRLDELKEEKEKTIIYSITELGIALLSGFGVHLTGDNGMKVLAGGIAAICGICIVTNGLTHYYNQEEIDDIKKYDIYLAIKSRLEKNKGNPNLFRNIKNPLELNINTIDSYTLDEVKQVKKNVKRCEYFNHFN